jgi:hypothetical protein
MYVPQGWWIMNGIRNVNRSFNPKLLIFDNCYSALRLDEF